MIATQAVERGAAGAFGRRLRSREPLIGTVVTVPSVAMAELAAGPVGFVWADLEHRAFLRRELAARKPQPADAHVGT